MWILNWIIDGLDGAYAWRTNQTSDFGGYLDIIVDFTIYQLIPLANAIILNEPKVWIVTCLMIGSWMVNAASLFFLSALISQNEKA